MSQTTFGLLWQYPVHGQVYAQPLAVGGLSGVDGCSAPCNLVFIATQRDMLYAFNANSSSSTPVWSRDLAAEAGGSYVDCRTVGGTCTTDDPIYPYIGVTGTPVIDVDAGILYVVSAVHLLLYPSDVQYYLHAINIKTGVEVSTDSPHLITASFIGKVPSGDPCLPATGTGSTINFDPLHHLQRAGLLLLQAPNNGTKVVYVAFTPYFGGEETQNGWILGYTFNGSTFSDLTPFVTTPFGTGGGIWESGAGLASDGTNIYVATANGTFDATATSGHNTEYGDTLLKLAVNGSGALTVTDYFTPSDQATLCSLDLDFGPGGVMVFPEPFYAGHDHLMVSGDKESRLFVADRDSLGGYHSTDAILEEQTLPASPPPGAKPRYYSTPAYWKYTDPVDHTTTRYALYYSVKYAKVVQPPHLDMYRLQTSGPPGPIPSGAAWAQTGTRFCLFGANPSISANPPNGMTGGILWAIERVNNNSPDHCDSDTWKPAVLHAYDATNVATDLYNSGAPPGLSEIKGLATKFLPPTIFKGKVFMGTLGQASDYGTDTGEVDVFGLCGNPSQCQH